VRIIRAGSEHLEQVAGLFDLYRQFYECEPDLENASAYIRDRLAREESVIFLAMDREQAVGFVQLYPSFCSVDMIRILILYDLYVASAARRRGVGEALMRRATDYARECGAERLDLLTAKDNFSGQALYEKLGYQRTNEDFFAYSLELSS
jgi:ribosomal protein S18 acetylase RimI-like enzyme